MPEIEGRGAGLCLSGRPGTFPSHRATAKIFDRGRNSGGSDTIRTARIESTSGHERNRLFVAMTRQMEADTPWVLAAYARQIAVVQPWVLGHKVHPFLYSIVQYVDVKPH